ncbi:MAG: lantibiotic dehydratase [bacterium]
MMRDAYRPDDFFAFRTPLLPWDEVLEWSAGARLPRAVRRGRDLAKAYAVDRRRQQEWLRAAYSRPDVREALFVASPSLDERYETWLAEPDSEKGRGIEVGLVKYYQRMAARCTPFGLFAGCSIGSLGAETRIELLERSAYGRHTRLDMDFIGATIDALNRDPAVRSALRYVPNSSAYRVADSLRYAEARLSGRTRSYFLVDANADIYLTGTLERAADGARREELAEALVDDDITREDALAYVDELVDAQLLVSELQAIVTGPEAIDDLLERLAGLPDVAEARSTLEQIRDELVDLDALGLGHAGERYRALKRSLEPLPADADLARLFQVDMTKPAAHAELGDEVRRELTAAVDLLHRIHVPPEETGLDRFRKDFTDRWGADWVSLAEALDEEIGLGFQSADHGSAEAAPLLEGIGVGGTAGTPQFKKDSRALWLRQLLDDALESDAEEIVIREDQVPTTPAGPPLPDALAIMAVLLTPLSPDDPIVRLRNVGGPSGARLLGRFCHSDPALLAGVRAHIAAEEALAPDVTFFEIAHLPDGRVGNVICRPCFRDHEFAYLGRSGAPTERTFSLDDLEVSVRGSRVVLRSRTLDREVRPRLSNAHNTVTRSVVVYRFLAALQAEGCLSGTMWSWAPFDESRRTPRVRFGRVILAPRTWRADAKEIETWKADRPEEVFANVQRWREARRLPRFVGVVDADHVMPVDLDNVLSVEAFVDLVRNRPGFQLEELEGDRDRLAVSGPEGRFCNEIVSTWVRVPAPDAAFSANGSAPGATESVVPVAAAAEPRPAPASVQRSFVPGSEWLFAKIYTGPATGDVLLQDVVRPLAREAMTRGLASGWFFIRYGDPKWHLRVRFRGEPGVVHGQVLPALHRAVAPFLDDGRVSQMVLDTYVRETERYGGPAGVEICEEIFQADSEACLEVLGLLEGDTGADLRWRAALYGCDRLLRDFGFDEEEMHAVMSRVADAFSSEFRVTGALRDRVMGRYRKERSPILQLVSNGATKDEDTRPFWDAVRRAFDRRSELQGPRLVELRRRADAGELATPIPDLVSSLLHMHSNRMFRTAARAQEMMIYRFLERTHDSLLARAGKKARDRKGLTV